MKSKKKFIKTRNIKPKRCLHCKRVVRQHNISSLCHNCSRAERIKKLKEERESGG